MTEEDWLLAIPFRSLRESEDLIREYGSHEFVGERNCTPAQNSTNQQALANLDINISLLNGITTAARQINSSSVNGRGVEAAIQTYNAQNVSVSYYNCSPTGQQVINKYDNQYVPAFDASASSVLTASNTLFGNADQDLAALQSSLTALKSERDRFETEAMGGGGLAAIEVEIAKCEAKTRELQRYYFGNWYAEHNARAAQYYARIASLAGEVNQNSQIDELDRLRNEYIVAPKGNYHLDVAPTRGSIMRSCCYSRGPCRLPITRDEGAGSYPGASSWPARGSLLPA